MPVQVEMGVGYADPDVLRPTVAFGDYVSYLERFEEREEEERRRNDGGVGDNSNVVDGEGDGEELVYLAQNDLPPGIAGDLPIPSLCSDPTHHCGEGRLYSTMIWMGPRGTVSPLHFDPLDNLLMQIVGTKRVLLYPSDDESGSSGGGIGGGSGGGGVGCREGHGAASETWHYAGRDGNQYNTSAVDVESPDLDQYPLFGTDAPVPYECTIGPGDALYIPKRWWHHVRALETSTSVNAWWR